MLYDYQNTKYSSCSRYFLKWFSRILQTDGYYGYNHVEDVKILYCLAHIKRMYFDIVSKLKDESVKKYLIYLMDLLSNLEDESYDMLIKYMPWFLELLKDVKLKTKIFMVKRTNIKSSRSICSVAYWIYFIKEAF